MSPETLKFITDITAILSPYVTALATLIGAVWVAVTYFRSQKDAAAARLFESGKPFLELLLKLYVETAQVSARLLLGDKARRHLRMLLVGSGNSIGANSPLSKVRE